MILCLIADGRSIHTQRWGEYFAQRGHEVHLITYDPMNRTIEGVIEHVVDSRWQNLYFAFIPRHIRIKRIVHSIKPDLIHAHFIAKYGFHLPILKNHPSIITAWGDDVLILPKKSLLIHWYSKKVLNYVDLVYVVSHDIGNHITSDFGISSKKIKYLPFGIDTDLFFPEFKNDSRIRNTIEVFSNRGFFPVYDNETLVIGFAAAYNKNKCLRLTLKGNGPDEKKIRGLVQTLGISDVVTFRQKTDYCNVPNDYRNADIFISTSRSDGTPVSLLEAMASGLPCVATSVGGVPEVIEDKKTGLLIEPGSPEGVTKALLTLAGNAEFRLKLGEAARDTVMKGGQWKTLMAQADKDYQELIETYKQNTP